MYICKLKKKKPLCQERLCLAHFHPAELRLPAIERSRADPVLPAKIRRLHTGLVLLQYPDDLFFCVPALLHRESSRSDYERTPASTGRVFRGQVKARSPLGDQVQNASQQFFVSQYGNSAFGPFVQPFFIPVTGIQKKCSKNLEQKLDERNIQIEEFTGMPPFNSIDELPFPAAGADAAPATPSEIECEVMRLFEQFRDPLLRYALSFGICMHDAEEVIQEVFLSLFQHLQSGRSRKNLRGWIFRVAHNLALKQRYANQRSRDKTESGETVAQLQFDPAPNPEEHLSSAQRQGRLLAVVRAMRETDQNCLRLRAEGLRYREIASIVGISLGAVSMSLTRSIARLIRADGR
jgi:RNA polymerase sigma-70 factor, ECF subfamily